MPYTALDPTAAAPAPAFTYGQPEAIGAHPAGKSLLQLRTRLKFELGNRSDLLDPQLNEWINDAYQDFYSSLDLPESKRSFSLMLVADQPFYLLPSTVDTVRSVSAQAEDVDNAGAALRPSDVFLYRKRPIRTGDPEEWFREQQMLVLWPTPDNADTLTVDVKIKPAPLTADGHYPILEDKWHEALFKGAKYRGWEGIQNDTKAVATMNEMSRLVQRKKDRDAGDTDETYPALRPIFSRRDLMSVRSKPQVVEPGDCE